LELGELGEQRQSEEAVMKPLSQVSKVELIGYDLVKTRKRWRLQTVE